MKYVGAAAGAFAGDYIAENFILKDPDGTTGFVTKGPGFGLDDVVRYTFIAVGALAGAHFLGHKGA